MEPIRPIGPRDPSVARIDGMHRAAHSGERDADGRGGHPGPRREPAPDPPAGDAPAPASDAAGDAHPAPLLLDVRA